MITITGQKAPLPSNGEQGRVDLLDLVMLIGRKGRFGDCGLQEYKVLHHSMLVGLLWVIGGFPKEYMVYATIHDFAEAYIGDLPSPIKYMNEDIARSFKNIEYYLDDKIYQFLNIEPPTPEIKKMVKICDNAALIIESVTIGPPGVNISTLKEWILDQEAWDLAYLAMPTLQSVSKTMKGC